MNRFEAYLQQRTEEPTDGAPIAGAEVIPPDGTAQQPYYDSGAADDWSRIEALDDMLEPAMQRTLKEPVDALVTSFTRRYASRRLPDDLQARIDRDRAALVVGHERGFTFRVYNPEGLDLAMLREVVEAVRYEGLELCR